MKTILYYVASMCLKLFRMPRLMLIKSRLAKCGKDVVITFPCKLSKPQNVHLGDYTLIQPNVTFIMNKGKVYVGNWSVIASNCTIITDNHIPTVGVNHRMLGRYHINDKVKDIVIEEDCWAGAGVTLMSGAKMRRGSIAAAGAVVNKEVPPYAVVAGIPAKIIASVFSIDQIIDHEKFLYPENERFTREELENIFNSYFVGKKSIGKDYVEIPPNNFIEINNYKYMQYDVPYV